MKERLIDARRWGKKGGKLMKKVRCVMGVSVRTMPHLIYTNPSLYSGTIHSCRFIRLDVVNDFGSI